MLIAANLLLLPKNASVFGSPVCASLALFGSPARLTALFRSLRLLVLPQSGKNCARCGSAPLSRVTNFFAYHKRRMRLLLIAANLLLLPKNASVFGSPVCASPALFGSPARLTALFLSLRLLVLPQSGKNCARYVSAPLSASQISSLITKGARAFCSSLRICSFFPKTQAFSGALSALRWRFSGALRALRRFFDPFACLFCRKAAKAALLRRTLIFPSSQISSLITKGARAFCSSLRICSFFAKTQAFSGALSALRWRFSGALNVFRLVLPQAAKSPPCGGRVF